jgi:hypothetical protein
MRDRRSGDSSTKTFFRTERFIKENDAWYFSTREGTIQGPFDDLGEARKELEEYINIMMAQGTGQPTPKSREPLSPT